MCHHCQNDCSQLNEDKLVRKRRDLSKNILNTNQIGLNNETGQVLTDMTVLSEALSVTTILPLINAINNLIENSNIALSNRSETALSDLSTLIDITTQSVSISTSKIDQTTSFSQSETNSDPFSSSSSSTQPLKNNLSYDSSQDEDETELENYIDYMLKQAVDKFNSEKSKRSAVQNIALAIVLTTGIILTIVMIIYTIGFCMRIERRRAYNNLELHDLMGYYD